MSTTPQNGAELLARIRPVLATETTQICLRPDLIKAWESASDDLVKGQVDDAASGEGRMADRAGPSANTRKLAERVQELEAEIEAHAITFTFQALPKDRWRELTEQHPPRKDNRGDAFMGYNQNAVEDQAVRTCMIDPIFEDCTKQGCDHGDCGSWQAFVEVCNPSEWNELREAVRRVNGSVTDLPKSHLASQILLRRGATSKPPAPGA